MYRIAKLEDLPILNRISVQSKKFWGYPEEWIERWLDDLMISDDQFKNQQILVAEKEDHIIGFCSIVKFVDHYEILHLWVLPEFIGRGYGKALLQRTLANFVAEDLPIIVESDPNAEAFYNSQGFVTFDQIESYPPGRFLPVMKKDPG